MGACYWTEKSSQPLAGFTKRFPDVTRAANIDEIFEDPEIALLLIAAPPEHLTSLAMQAMLHGKDVMLDKLGCLTLDELTSISTTIKNTGRIWSVNFSERFEVPCAIVASRIVAEGQIGEVISTTSLGPHRLNPTTRPDWFWDAKRYGGILGDIGMHQIDQFLHFSNASNAEITHSTVGNFSNKDRPAFQDFGEINLRAGNAHGYARMDWYTQDALSTWGDGRLFVLGTEGSIELRKYLDIEGRAGTDHLFLMTNSKVQHIDCSHTPLEYFSKLSNDIRDRTDTDCNQQHTLKVTELAIRAQINAGLQLQRHNKLSVKTD